MVQKEMRLAISINNIQILIYCSAKYLFNPTEKVPTSVKNVLQLSTSIHHLTEYEYTSQEQASSCKSVSQKVIAV
jgi:hypothetical protein